MKSAFEGVPGMNLATSTSHKGCFVIVVDFFLPFLLKNPPA